MTTEALTMRKTAQELGISQLRVRELIKKGRLEAEKVSDGSGEHWEISRESIESFRQEREENSSNGTPSGGQPSPSDGPAGSHLAALLPELEQQLERVKALIQEISRAQSYLDGLRKTQRRLEEEIATARRRVADEPQGAHESGDGPSPKAEPPKADEAGEPAAPAPKPSEKKDEGKKRKARKGETNVGAALRDVGLDEGPPEKGAKGKKKTDG